MPPIKSETKFMYAKVKTKRKLKRSFLIENKVKRC